MSFRLGSTLRALSFSLCAIPSLLLSSAGVAPLPPGFHKLLSVTVMSCAVFPSWMYLPGGDDNCMLSVPSSACDLHIWCWQGGEICQATVAAAFTLFSHALMLSAKIWMTSLLSNSAVLTTCYLLLDSRPSGPTLRPSAPVFRCHRDSWTRGWLALVQEAVRCPLSLSVSLLGFIPVALSKVIQATFEKCLSSRDVEMWRPWIDVNLFLVSPPFILSTLGHAQK